MMIDESVPPRVFTLFVYFFVIGITVLYNTLIFHGKCSSRFVILRVMNSKYFCLFVELRVGFMCTFIPNNGEAKISGLRGRDFDKTLLVSQPYFSSSLQGRRQGEPGDWKKFGLLFWHIKI